MVDKVAVITGSSKGIGYAIVKALCKRGVRVVYLTARDVGRGLQAVEKLNQEGLNPEFHQLDITDVNSIKEFADYLKAKHGGLDILINNAAVNGNAYEITYEDAVNTVNVNYRSLYAIEEYLFPILKDNARVINISSGGGHITFLKNDYWVKRLINEDIEYKDVDDFMYWFLESVKNNKLKKEDFHNFTFLPYAMSKVALCALTRAQQKKLSRGISVNSLQPGFVKTEMTKYAGTLTTDQASEAPVYLALDCDQSIKGKFFSDDKSEIDWTDTNFQLKTTSEFDEEYQKLLKAYQ